MTKYVVYDKDSCEFLATLYINSTSFDRHRNNAIETDTIEEAQALKSLAKARCNSSRILVIRVTETTETEFNPDAPHVK